MRGENWQEYWKKQCFNLVEKNVPFQSAVKETVARQQLINNLSLFFIILIQYLFTNHLVYFFGQIISKR